MSDVEFEVVEPDVIEVTVGDLESLSASVGASAPTSATASTVIPVEATVSSPEEIISVNIVAEGPRGPEGPQGPPGPPGDSETAISYTHYQLSPAQTWLIRHNLGYFPGGITVQDGAGTTYEGEVTYLDRNNVRIMFAAGTISGTAYLS